MTQRKGETREEYLARCREWQRIYSQEHKEERRKYCEANEEKIKEYKSEYMKRYYQEHKAERKRYAQTNKERIAEYQKIYSKEYRTKKAEEKRREKEAECARLGIEIDHRYKKLKHPFCSEPISNVEGFDEMMANPTVRYVIHHRRETHTLEGLPLGYNCYISASMLKTQGLYYKRPASELVFMATDEHTKLHQTKTTYKE